MESGGIGVCDFEGSRGGGGRSHVEKSNLTGTTDGSIVENVILRNGA